MIIHIIFIYFIIPYYFYPYIHYVVYIFLPNTTTRIGIQLFQRFFMNIHEYSWTCNQKLWPKFLKNYIKTQRKYVDFPCFNFLTLLLYEELKYKRIKFFNNYCTTLYILFYFTFIYVFSRTISSLIYNSVNRTYKHKWASKENRNYVKSLAHDTY